MNELVIEKDNELYLDSSQFVQLFGIDTTDDLFKFLTKSDVIGFVEILELASTLSFLEPSNLERNLKLIDLAEIMMGDKDNKFLISSMRMMVSKNFLDSRPNEFDIHELFKSEYKKVLGDDYSIVERKNNPKHIPDFWLMNKGEYIPVEIKLHDFKNKHLNQLRRYMDFYGCEKGIAVARELRCALPSNIKFISYINSEVI